jgi:hypothetical protein
VYGGEISFLLMYYASSYYSYTSSFHDQSISIEVLNYYHIVLDNCNKLTYSS